MPEHNVDPRLEICPRGRLRSGLEWARLDRAHDEAPLTQMLLINLPANIWHFAWAQKSLPPTWLNLSNKKAVQLT